MLSYVEVDTDNLRHNLKELKNLLKPQAQVIAVIKANAYGHDQNLIAKALQDQVDYFQVDDLGELHRLREISQTPTLVLGYVSLNGLAEAAGLNGILGVYNLETIRRLNEIGKQKDQPRTVAHQNRCLPWPSGSFAGEFG